MTLFKKSHSVENPHITSNNGRREWNDRYDNLAKSRRYWQVAFAAAISLAIIQSFFMGRMALRTSIQPFVVAANQGMPYAILPVNPVSADDSRIVNYALNQFIMNVRSVVSDKEAEKNILTKVYAYSAKQTKVFLRDYFNAHDPFKAANQYTVSIQIVNSLPISKNTWQITWDEIKKDSTGSKLIEKSRWLAQLHYELGSVSPHFMTDNPFGIYITEITWSESQIHDG